MIWKLKNRKKKYCVIGLGNFGLAVTRELLRHNKNVIVIDNNKNIFNDHFKLLENAECKQLDSTNEDVMNFAGIQECTTVIVAIGSNIESNLITCSILLDLKIPKIICKVKNDHHEKILRKIGIKEIVRPEYLSGKETALKAIFDFALSFQYLTSKYSLFSAILKNKNFDDVVLKNLNLRKHYNCNIILINHNDKIKLANSNTKMHLNDIIYFISDFSSSKNVLSLFQKS